MNVRFKLAAPETAQVTLTMTADLIEWRSLRDALVKAEGQIDFTRALNKMIQQFAEMAVSDYWTTGYATGVVTEEGKK